MEKEIVKGVPTEALRKRYVVEIMKIEGITYLSRMVSCGKKGCSACPHGPYWYAAFKRKGRYREVYIGKRFMTLTESNENKRRRRESEKDGRGDETDSE